MAIQQDDQRGRMLIDRESTKLDRAHARAKSLENNMTETIASFMKNKKVKENLAKDAMAATRDPSRRSTIFEKAHGGTFGGNDDETITGDEPRYWER